MNSNPNHSQTPEQNALLMQDLSFAYRSGGAVIQIPRWEVARGDSVFIKGPSGSGKSTLLGLIGGVLKPSSGTLQVLGEDLMALRAAERDRFRADNVGFIFQLFNLLPYLSVLDNVTLPVRFSRRRAQAVSGPALKDQAQSLLERLGLDAALCLRPVTKLSVGQQQRVAAARALMGRPGLLVADEPTSALDADNREHFIAVLLNEAQAAGSTVLFVSHDATLAPYFNRSVDVGEINQVTTA